MYVFIGCQIIAIALTWEAATKRSGSNIETSQLAVTWTDKEAVYWVSIVQQWLVLGGTESVKVVLEKKEQDLKPLLSFPTQGDRVRSVGQAGVLLCILNVGHLVKERNMKMVTTTKIHKYQRHQMYQQFDLSVWFPPSSWLARIRAQCRIRPNRAGQQAGRGTVKQTYGWNPWADWSIML